MKTDFLAIHQSTKIIHDDIQALYSRSDLLDLIWSMMIDLDDLTAIEFEVREFKQWKELEGKT